MNIEPYQIYRLRLVHHRDEEQLSHLYQYLDTCNGNPDRCSMIIEDSVESMCCPISSFKSLTFVIDQIDYPDPENNSTEYTASQIVASARLIKIGSKKSPVMMYIEKPDGFQLEPYRGGLLEFAGAVVHPEHQRRGLGNVLTITRALIARLFTEHIQSDKVFTEFLPIYDPKQMYSNQVYKNAFWDFLLDQYLNKNNLCVALSKLTGVAVQTEGEILQALLRNLKTADRNKIINRHFPTWLSGLSKEARYVTEMVNPKSQGSLINFQRVYSRIDKVGNFAVDGGSNYTAHVQDGAQGDRVVECYWEEDHFMDRAIVFHPFNIKSSTLIDFQAVITPGIYRQNFAKLSPRIKNILSPDKPLRKIAYYLLSTKQKLV